TASTAARGTRSAGSACTRPGWASCIPRPASRSSSRPRSRPPSAGWQRYTDIVQHSLRDLPPTPPAPLAHPPGGRGRPEPSIEHLRMPGRVLLIGCYELGHQPLAVAWPAAFLEARGYAPALLDAAVAPLRPPPAA